MSVKNLRTDMTNILGLLCCCGWFVSPATGRLDVSGLSLDHTLGRDVGSIDRGS